MTKQFSLHTVSVCHEPAAHSCVLDWFTMLSDPKPISGTNTLSHLPNIPESGGQIAVSGVCQVLLSPHGEPFLCQELEAAVLEAALCDPRGVWPLWPLYAEQTAVCVPFLWPQIRDPF